MEKSNAGKTDPPTDPQHKSSPMIGKLKTVATSSNGMPVIGCMERSETGGRVVVDSGFTKLYPHFWVSEGQVSFPIIFFFS